MKNLIEDTIEKIKRESIRPEPQWKYLAKKYSVWISFFASVFAGAAFFSVAYFLITQLDWDLYSLGHRGPIYYFLSLLPYLWIVPLIILAVLTFFNLRKTEMGYRYNFSKIIVVVLGSLFVFGMAMAFYGFGGKINGAAMHGFPGYGKLVTTKESQWSQPENGLLAGTINSVSENSIDLQDLEGKEWQITYNEDTVIRPSVILESGEMIKTIGQAESNRTFKADEIRPWQGKGRMRKKECVENGKYSAPESESKGTMNGRQK